MLGKSDVDNPKQLPTVLSLCTGYGGIERGLELAGFRHRVITHVEIEAFAIANLVAKMETAQLAPAPVWTDLKTLPVECFRDRVSVITGGYPCQPFSSAGKRAGKDDPRHLWPYIRDIIQAVRPFRVFFENVFGHISLGLSTVISDLEEDGYRTEWGIFSAAEVGAPHERKRVFIMADAVSPRGTAGIPEPRHEQKRNARIAYNGSDKQGGWQGEMYWATEPGILRVVDGCENRADRLRLLGNGVVPQTAAKAWRVLSARSK